MEEMDVTLAMTARSWASYGYLLQVVIVFEYREW